MAAELGPNALSKSLEASSKSLGVSSKSLEAPSKSLEASSKNLEAASFRPNHRGRRSITAFEASKTAARRSTNASLGRKRGAMRLPKRSPSPRPHARNSLTGQTECHKYNSFVEHSWLDPYDRSRSCPREKKVRSLLYFLDFCTNGNQPVAALPGTPRRMLPVKGGMAPPRSWA